MKITKGTILKYRVLMLSENTKMTRKQIAEVLNIPTKTVRRFIVRDKGLQNAINFAEKRELVRRRITI